MPELIDTHAHTGFDRFDEDRADVYRRAREAGVQTIIEVGVGLEGSRKAVELAASEPLLRAAVGIHPSEANHLERDWDAFEQLVRTHDVTAIGECGLDYYWNEAPKDLQKEAFRRQIHLARQMALPFIVHCRDAEADLIEVLRAQGYPADHLGVYNHPRAPRRDDFDNRFQGYGEALTDGDGRYRFLTIVPVPYTGRPPHIHVKIKSSAQVGSHLRDGIVQPHR